MITSWVGPRKGQRLLAYVLLSLGCVAFALVAGKDLNWDLINYHYYLGFSAFHDRFSQDFLPASVVSYAPPYAYAPLYLLVSAGIDDRVVVIALAVMGSVALWAVWELGGLMAVAARGVQRFSVLQAYLAAALAAICPVFLIQLGTSFIDVTTGAVALFGYVFLARFVLKRALTELVIAAALLGIAVALKQTNVVYALAGAALVFAAGSPRARNLGIYSIAGVTSGAVVTAPWGIGLYGEFGNPFFPNLNSIFRSPDFDSAPMAPHYRFIPDTWIDALLRPIWMMSPEKGVQMEVPAPDARFFFLAVFIAIACGAVIVRRVSTWVRKEPVSTSEGDSVASRGSALFWGLIAACVFSWCVWLAISGNGRYFMPMALLVAPLLVACIHFVATNRRWILYSFSLVFVGSLALVLMGSAFRFHPAPWTGKYFDVEVPDSLVDRPHLILSLGTQPAAFIVPSLHPESSFISLIGIHVLGPGRPGWERVEGLLGRSGAPMFLMPANEGDDGKMVPPDQGKLDGLTARIGYRIDRERCEQIVVNGLLTSSDRLSHSSDGAPQVHLSDRSRTMYAICPGHRDEGLREQYIAQVAKVDPLLDLVERSCPSLFSGKAVTEGLGDNWRRVYGATDATLYYSQEKIRYHRYGHNRPRVLGDASVIERGDFRVDCNRKRDPLLTIDDILNS